ncbi:hypothetical protein LB505_009724 [Fusarium chuoi]|nr:hypothetical protein LB505_009724 [Fusarium chuoi]
MLQRAASAITGTQIGSTRSNMVSSSIGGFIPSQPLEISRGRNRIMPSACRNGLIQLMSRMVGTSTTRVTTMDGHQPILIPTRASNTLASWKSMILSRTFRIHRSRPCSMTMRPRSCGATSEAPTKL